MKNTLLALLALLGFAAGATEALTQAQIAARNEPVGFFIDNLDASDMGADEVKSHARFIRDGKEYEAFAGHEVYVGDTIITDATGGITIAFLNNSAAKLGGSTEFSIDGAGSKAERKGAELTLVHGRASFLTNPVDIYETFLNLGGLGSHGVGGSGNGGGGGSSSSKNCLAQFEVIVNQDANGTTFTSSVAVLKGTATLTPKGSSTVDMASGTLTLMTLNTKVDGVTTSPVTLQQNNLSNAQITALLANSVSNTITCVNKDGSVTIKSAIKNSDGTVSVGSITTVNGKVTKDNWTTSLGKKKVDNWVETATKISITKVYDGYTLATSVSKPSGLGLATLKGPNGQTYKGTTKYDPNTGSYVFTSTKPGKDGSNTIFSFNPNGPNGPVNTVVIIPASGPAQQIMQSFNKLTGVMTTITQTGKVVNGVFVADSTPPVVKTVTLSPAPPGGTLPDGHKVDDTTPPTPASP